MKKHLFIYAFLILAFVVFNLFGDLGSKRLNTAANLLLGSIIFGYISWIAIVVLFRMKK